MRGLKDRFVLSLWLAALCGLSPSCGNEGSTGAPIPGPDEDPTSELRDARPVDWGDDGDAAADMAPEPPPDDLDQAGADGDPAVPDQDLHPPQDAADVDDRLREQEEHDWAIHPVLFVHGVNGSAENFDTMRARLVEDGWPSDHLFAYTFDDPSWGCNIDNADTIRGWVEAIREQTGHAKIDIVAHSMGTLSSRWYIKFLGGQEVVSTYVTLGGMHHGLITPCLSPIQPCIWEELCSSGEFIEALNDDPATPGHLWWVSIYGTADSTVPNWSSELDGAENIELVGVTHDGPDGLLEHQDAYVEVRRVLAYPAR